MNALDRFRLRVVQLMEQRSIKQKDLRGDNTAGWISNVMTARRGIRLLDMEDIAKTLEVPLAELLRHPEDVIYELTGNEARVVEAYRRLSPTEQAALLTLATLRYRTVGRPRQQYS